MTADEFFTEVCPKLLHARESFCKAVGGSYQFELTGAGGGTFTLDFDRCQVTRRVGDPPRALILVERSIFDAWLQGRVDWPRILESGGAQVVGSRRAVATLVQLLDPRPLRPLLEEEEGPWTSTAAALKT